MAPNAVSRPSFICRPSSRAGPLNGAAMPKRISLSVTPLTLRLRGVVNAAVVVVTAVGAAAVAGAAGRGATADGAAKLVGAAVCEVSSDGAGDGRGVTTTGWTGRAEFDASCGVAAGVAVGAEVVLLNL